MSQLSQDTGVAMASRRPSQRRSEAVEPPDTWAILGRTVGLLRPYRRRAAASLAAGVVMICLHVTIPVVIGATVDGALAQTGARKLLLGAGLVAMLALGRWVAAVWRRDGCGRLGADLESALRAQVWRHLVELDFAGPGRLRVGDLLSRLSTDIRAVRTFLTWTVVFIVLNGLMLVTASVQMFLLSPTLALYVAVMAPVLVSGALTYNRRLLLRFRLVQRDTGLLCALTEQLVTGVRTVKAFGRERYESAEFAKAAGQLRDGAVAAAGIRSTFEPLLGVLPQLAMVAVIWHGGWMAMTGRISVGTVLVFVSYLLMLSWPVKALGLLIGQSTGALAAAERVFELLDREPSVRERSGAVPLPAADRWGLAVRLDDVSLTGAEGRNVLDRARMTLPAGSRVLVKGGNAAGKTALARLLCRLCDPTGGTVLLDGTDVRELTLGSVRRAVLMLGPEPDLFQGTVRENLLFGHTDQVSEAAMWAALQSACIADAVAGWPAGLDTVLLERGSSLSGGERQRLALARALLHRPRLLVLDDALCHLDPMTEQRVLRHLADRVPATTLLLSNRYVPIPEMTAAYVLAQGRLRPLTGPHADDLPGVDRLVPERLYRCRAQDGLDEAEISMERHDGP